MIAAARLSIRQRVPPRGWKDVLWRVWTEVSDANLFLVAGGVTYAILLALFPVLAALISIYGLAFDASQVEKQIDVLAGVLPAESLQLLSDEVHKLLAGSTRPQRGRRFARCPMDRLSRNERSHHRAGYCL